MVFEKVKEVMVDTLSCDEEKVTMEANLADDLKIDSLDSVELAMSLEEEFGIKIPDSELFEMKTVADIVAAIEKRQ